MKKPLATAFQWWPYIMTFSQVIMQGGTHVQTAFIIVTHHGNESSIATRSRVCKWPKKKPLPRRRGECPLEETTQ
jgi:hypothetical protein